MNSRPSLLRTLLLVVALWSGIGVFAQPGKTKVVLYKDRLAAAFDTVDCVKNVVKFNPLAPAERSGVFRTGLIAAPQPRGRCWRYPPELLGHGIRRR